MIVPVAMDVVAGATGLFALRKRTVATYAPAAVPITTTSPAAMATVVVSNQSKSFLTAAVKVIVWPIVRPPCGAITRLFISTLPVPAGVLYEYTEPLFTKLVVVTGALIFDTSN